MAFAYRKLLSSLTTSRSLIMFRRIVTFLTLISILTLLPNEIGQRLSAFPSATPASDKVKKTACAPCSTGTQSVGPLDKLDRLATLGRRTQAFPFAPLSRSVFEGVNINLVSTATGHLAFAVTDLSLSGAMPIKFQRIYASDRSGDTGLGIGWSFSYDDRVTIEGKTATLTTGAGSVVAFRRDGASQRFVLKPDDPAPHQSLSITNPDTLLEQGSGLTKTYKRFGQIYRLSQIADANGNKVAIAFDARGNVSSIANDNGGALSLKWSDSKDARLLSITDHTGQQVSYRQDGQRLRAVMDSSGAQLTYDYEAKMLTRAADPAGRVLLRVRYDKARRVVEAGDAVGAFLYQYEPASGVSRRTVVTDPIGVKTSYEHTERGLITALSNDGAGTAWIEYNAANRPVLVSDSNGDETRFTYDAQNRLLRLASSDGTEEAYTYDGQGQISSLTRGGERIDYTRDARGNIIAARSNNPAKSYSVTLNARGQAISARSGSGREITSEYDTEGNEKAFAFSDVGRFQVERDARGRIITENLPSGLTQRYEYDSRGRVKNRSDNRGRSVTLERDASGALTGVVTARGNWIRATRDEVGRIVAVTNSAGKSRRFTYDARGALTDYTDARGKSKKLRYDQRGRVRDITDSQGNKTSIERDGRGRPQRISFSDGTLWRYEYDRNGKLANVKREGTGKTNSTRFVSANLNHSAASSAKASAPPTYVDCFFSNDNFYDSLDWGWQSWGGGSGEGEFGSSGFDTFDYSGYDCSDPFGGLSGDCASSLVFDAWLYDSWAGFECGAFSGETYEQCVARQQQICRNKRISCGVSAAGVYGAATAACYIALLANPLIGAICAAAAFLKYVGDLTACDLADRNCRLEIPDKCQR
jgi:YD repeat-containing protein